MQFIKPGSSYDFVGKRRFAAIFSGALVGLSLLMMIGGSFVETPFSPRYGVDFSGGTEIHVRVAEGVGIVEIRKGLSSIGLPDDKVQAFGGSGSEYLIRVDQVNFGADEFFAQVEAELKAKFGADTWRSFDWDPEQSVNMTVIGNSPVDAVAIQALLIEELGNPDVLVTDSKVEHNALVVSFPGLTDSVKKALGGSLGGGEEAQFEVLSVEMVGPSVGAELREKGMLAILISLLLILVYVAFRFDLSFAPGAVIALFHDVVITVGVFCVIQHEFSLTTIGALLTIIGYSLNDTIVVYDRIRENLRRYVRRDLGEVVNLSLNETLSRTVLTSVTTMIAVLALIFFGGPIIRDFAIALAIGVVVGTYSSIFVASPMILFLQRWLPVEIHEEDEDRSPPPPHPVRPAGPGRPPARR